MKNSSSEVEAYMKSGAFCRKDKQVKEFLNIEKKDRKISADERDRVLNKVRSVLETGKGERLNKEDEEILKEIAGVYFSSYKKTIEILDNRELGGIEDER